MLRQELLDVIMTRIAEVLCLLQYVGGFLKLLSDDSVEDDVRTCDGLGRTHHTELELVTGKGKRRRTVTIGDIRIEIRHGVDTGRKDLALLRLGRIAGTDQLLHDILELGADERRNDRWWCLIRTETMLVSDIRRTEPEKVRMLIDRSQYAGQH